MIDRTGRMLREYRRQRRENPMMTAATALSIVRPSKTSHEWEQSGHDRWTRKLNGDLVAVLKVDNESIYPQDDDGYGSYVQEARPYAGEDWGGNYPQPETTDFPLGLPYCVFRYTGVSQGDGGYFVPDDIEGYFTYMRDRGCSKSVAWDLTRAMVERQITDLFDSPLTYCYVNVTVEHNGVELGSAGIGTTYCGGDDYPLECADECGLVDEALDAARTTVEILKAVTV